MPLVVEDGSARADAEAYITVAEATAYFAARGNAAWAAIASDTIREQLLRTAADYMQQAYRSRWVASRVTATQALDWPRAWVKLPDAPSGYGAWAAFVPNNVVPVEVKRANAELALIASTGALAPNLTRSKLRTKVGPIEVEYDKGAPEYTRFRSVDMLLAPYLGGSSVNVGLVRA